MLYGSISTILFLAALSVNSLAIVGQELQKSNSQAGDEAAIRGNVKQVEDGWNTKDGTLFAKPFAEDADYIAINGFQAKGRKIIEEGHQQIFKTRFKDSTINLSVKQIRFLRPDVAVVQVTGHNKTKQGDETQEWDLIVSMVMSKEAGEWKIVSFQNTRVDSGRR